MVFLTLRNSRMTLRSLAVVATVALCFSTSLGCALSNNATQKIQIYTEPSGMNIYLLEEPDTPSRLIAPWEIPDGERRYVGKSPLEIDMKREDKSYVVFAELAGVSQTAQCKAEMNRRGKIDYIWMAFAFVLLLEIPTVIYMKNCDKIYDHKPTFFKFTTYVDREEEILDLIE